MEKFVISASTRDLTTEVLDSHGVMRVLPSSFWAETTPEERGKFGYLNGIYHIPTTELVDYLKEFIGDRRAIEIGSGNGVLANALGITGTDSYQQEDRKYADVYAQDQQPPVRYGKQVVQMPAHRAVRIYQPDVVIACWVTHKWDRYRAWLGGNEAGVDEEDVIMSCREYVFIGNTKVHRQKPILTIPHHIEHPDFVYSRAMNGTPDFLAIWQGGRR